MLGIVLRERLWRSRPARKLILSDIQWGLRMHGGLERWAGQGSRRLEVVGGKNVLGGRSLWREFCGKSEMW